MATVIIVIICFGIVVAFFQYFTDKKLEYVYRFWGLYDIHENTEFIKKNTRFFMSMIFVPFFIPLLLSLMVFLLSLIIDVEYGNNTLFIDKIYLYHLIFTLFIIAYGLYEIGRDRLKETTSFTYDEAAQFSAFKIIVLPLLIFMLVIAVSILFKINFLNTLKTAYHIIFYVTSILLLTSIIFLITVYIYSKTKAGKSNNIIQKFNKNVLKNNIRRN